MLAQGQQHDEKRETLALDQTDQTAMSKLFQKLSQDSTAEAVCWQGEVTAGARTHSEQDVDKQPPRLFSRIIATKVGCRQSTVSPSATQLHPIASWKADHVMLNEVQKRWKEEICRRGGETLSYTLLGPMDSLEVAP